MVFADAKRHFETTHPYFSKNEKGGWEEGESHEALYVKFLPRANFHSCVIKTLKMEVYNGNADRPLTIAA